MVGTNEIMFYELLEVFQNLCTARPPPAAAAPRAPRCPAAAAAATGCPSVGREQIF